MDKPMTFIEWCASKGVIPYSLGIEAAYEAGQQSQQAKVEELQTLYTQQGINMLKMQKRVDGLIKKWKSESEYYDSIVSEDCVANTLNECIDDLEKALKGEG